MEALTAASVAALTIYDMCKAVDKNMEISSIYLEQKSGGKSGDWQKSTRMIKVCFLLTYASASAARTCWSRIFQVKTSSS